MLEFTSLDPEFWRKACAKPEGFAWWYLDLRTADGAGLVLLWGLGLPFVPRGRSEKEGALQLAFYERGRAEYYHLATFPAFDDLAMNGSFSLSSGSVRVSETGGIVSVEVSLRESSNLGDGFELELEVEGRAVPPQGPASGSHSWSPQTVLATSRGRLDFGGRSVRLEGSAYFDTNAALAPLPSQGIDVWRWGRLSFGDETILLYDVEGGGRRETLAFSIEADGRRVEASALTWLDERRAVFGIVAPRGGRVAFPRGAIEFRAEALVDDGPFYQRYLLEGQRGDGRRGAGFYEVVVPGRLDRPWQRPLVAMRVRRSTGERNSLWLPLFRGPRRGRLARLVRSWFPTFGASPEPRRLS